MPRYIGLMSGTSMDGVDGVLLEIDGAGLRVQGHAQASMPTELRAEFMALNRPGGTDELHRAALAGNALARVYAEVVGDLLAHSGLDAADVRAIGAHGQTVRHRPLEFDGDPVRGRPAVGYTLQLNSPSLLAELCGIDVVADFRSRDLAAGGQGAPLVPAFHRQVFGRTDRAVGVLNLGGIANVSVIGTDGTVTGFDCGPGNALMDHWCQAHQGEPWDAGGRWARSGRVDAGLLQALLSDPYFERPPPKSTGRDLFHPGWLAARLGGPPLSPEDVQSTLAELTARSCADAMRRWGGDAREWLVCGGGAYNAHLMERLAALRPDVRIATTEDRGLPPLQVEAAAFGWLAHRAMERLPGNLESVTGARGARVLGAIYPR